MYHDLMMDNIDEVANVRLKALKEIEKDKARVAKAYNKKVKRKLFQVGELVWKTILPIGSKSNKFSKWSSNWKGPYKVIKVIFGNSYLLETLQGERLNRAFNEILDTVFSKCLARSLSALQTMANTCIALRTKVADVYIALSH